ncbi:hypothetical protein HYPSUDRAFT_142547 [Hypholoma sublateritium FD-334 SS-4]|uniref:Uncharacterized protein n=1 Tax=Hypholoma sublateritium (strain FD-334 SS-4) TaxID=945553 RepID=A0A0D2PK02_HYPSF|nr:hypothetical protein HYPSUDRAFT_142547 [Hypholoma sublateritium FD-334 SS-4]
MAHFPQDPPRATMRRKSSAQNLLSSFKSSSPSPVPPPLALAGPNVPFAAPAPTPTASTPLAREWDAQSLHSDTLSQSLAGAQSPPLAQGTSVEYLRDLVQKRIITLTYIRNIHEGRSHWFHTILISRAELDKVFNNADMKRRTARFAILGLSLSTLLDINQPPDLLRGLLNTITEYDQAKEEGDGKSKIFKGRQSRKNASGIAEYTGSYPDSSADASYLTAPSIPFPLDYHQTLLSLLDVLSEVYNKIAKLLGPSPFPHPSQHMMGPLGLLSPHPGVSYLFSAEGAGSSQSLAGGGGGGNAHPYQQQQSNLSLGLGGQPPLPDGDMSGSLWEIAHATPGGAGSQMLGGLPSAFPGGWSNTLGDMVLKIDSKLKKITSALLKDLDAFARNGIKDELASLDPLLRNLSVADDPGKIMYDFEGM